MNKKLTLRKSINCACFGNERSEIPETLWPVTRFREAAKLIPETGNFDTVA